MELREANYNPPHVPKQSKLSKHKTGNTETMSAREMYMPRRLNIKGSLLSEETGVSEMKNVNS